MYSLGVAAGCCSCYRVKRVCGVQVKLALGKLPFTINLAVAVISWPPPDLDCVSFPYLVLQTCVESMADTDNASRGFL